MSFQLISGAQCEVVINATEYIGRVIFDDVQGYLCIEGYDPEYDPKTKITFENEVGKVRIYNAQETGKLRFTISFSAATHTLATGALALLAAASLAAF